MMKNRLELSLAIALAAALLFCALPAGTTHWWSVAFSPLCDGVLSAGAQGEELVLKSKLLEWIGLLGH